MDEVESSVTEGDQLLEQLMRFKPEDMTANAWAVKAGVSRAIWADLRRHGNPSRRTLEKLLSAAGSTLAEFEALRVDKARQPESSDPSSGVTDARSAGWRAAPLMPVPLLETRLAGEWGEPGSGVELTELHVDSVRGHVARPASMAGDRDAYAFAILGDSMWPRFRPGRQLLVSPAAPIAIGDDVALQLRISSGSEPVVKLLVKELVRRTAAFVELRQFNPDVTFRVKASDVAALHKVVGEAI